MAVWGEGVCHGAEERPIDVNCTIGWWLCAELLESR